MTKTALIKLFSPSEKSPRPSYLTKIIAYVFRDFKIWWSYKLWVALDVTSTIFLVATYFFLSQIIAPERLISEGYVSGDYFTFALLGVAFSQYVFNSVQGLSHAIREEQWNGTMETILSAASRFETFLIGEASFLFIVSTVFLAASLLVGASLGAQFIATVPSMFTVAVFAFLLIVGHLIIGIMGAGIILKVKMGDPIVWAFTWTTQLISGVFFPLGLLPDYLRWVGYAFPLTYSLDGIRRGLMNGDSLLSSSVLQTNLIALIGFALVTTPIALWIFRYGYRSAQKEGTTSQF